MTHLFLKVFFQCLRNCNTSKTPSFHIYMFVLTYFWSPESLGLSIAMGWGLSSINIFFSRTLQNFVCNICRVRRQEIINFMTPYYIGNNFWVNSVKLMYFFKKIFLSTQVYNEVFLCHCEFLIILFCLAVDLQNEPI